MMWENCSDHDEVIEKRMTEKLHMREKLDRLLKQRKGKWLPHSNKAAVDKLGAIAKGGEKTIMAKAKGADLGPPVEAYYRPAGQLIANSGRPNILEGRPITLRGSQVPVSAKGDGNKGGK